MITVTCTVCGKLFEASRKSRKTCSNACRMRLSSGSTKDRCRSPTTEDLEKAFDVIQKAYSRLD